MFPQSRQEISLTDRQIRYAMSTRIGTVALAFFSAAWSLLQWALTTEQRFMVEGIARQFVQLEAAACAVIAVLAFAFVVANGIGWLATGAKIRRLRNSAARQVVARRSAQRVGAYV